MSEVKRYDMRVSLGGVESYESPCGDYVDYEDYAALQAKCEALAAENKRLKSAVTQQIELRAEIKKAGRPPHADFWVQSICEAKEKVKRALEETPATDAFLAEVRASELDSLAGIAETMLVKLSNQQCSPDMHEVVGWKMVLQQASKRAANIRK